MKVTALARGAILGAVQVAMVLSLGAKLLIDRSTMPRVWVRTAPYDPNLPIRGRYVSLRVAAEPRGFSSGVVYGAAQLSVEDGKLVAHPTEENNGTMVTISGTPSLAMLSEPVAYFIPEHAQDPSWRPRGEELWVEVTVPSKGPPRPIRLGVKKDGVLTPLDLR
jgi:GDYXXLXY protein